MALKSTVFKAELQISDMDRNHYCSHSLTLARHPSETDERMMVRLLAFALNASERLSFGRGLSDDEEADLWEKDFTDDIALWIDVGLPDEKWLKKACKRAQAVRVYAYGRAAEIWRKGLALDRCPNLEIFTIPPQASLQLAEFAERNMKLDFQIQEGHVWVSDAGKTVEIALARISPA